MIKQTALLASFLVLTAACSASSEGGTTSDPTGTTDDALGAAPGVPPEAAKPSPSPSPGGNYVDFVGAWTADKGSSPITTIVFEYTPDGKGHHFFAHAQYLVSASTPKDRPEGVFTVSKDFLVLDAKDGVPSLAGAYRYQFPSHDRLIINNGFETQTFTRAASYCDAPADCNGQGILHVECAGGFSCSKAHACSWQCGEPPVMDGTPCGKNLCGKGLACCNPVMGICAPKGVPCIQ